MAMYSLSLPHVSLTTRCAGACILSLAASLRTHDKAILAVGLANGDTQVLHLQLPNR